MNSLRLRLATALVLGLAAPLAAQTPTFSLPTSVRATPGSVATIPLTLTGAVADTAALNFTVRIPAAQAAFIRLSPGISATTTGSTSALLFQGNQLTTPGGEIEFRGVLYSSTNPGPTFNSTSAVQVVNLSIPLTDNVPVGTTINVEIPSGSSAFETRSGAKIGLLGISNSAGVSIVADSDGNSTLNPSLDRPLATAGSLSVGFEGFPTAYDLEAANINRWVFKQTVPFQGEGGVELAGTYVPGQGLRITQNANAAFYFAFYTFDFQFPTDSTGFANPPLNTVLRARWQTESNAPSGLEVPILRPSFVAADASVTAQSVYQRPFPGSPQTVVPVAGSPRVLETYGYTAAFLKDGNASDPGNPDGFNTPFDVYFSPGLNGAVGTEVTLKNLRLDVFSPAQLGAPTTVYTRNFATEGRGPFEKAPNNPIGPGLLPVAYDEGSANGIGIRPLEAPQGDSQFSYGWFETDSGLFTIDSSRIYRTRFTVGTDATNPRVPNVRMRYFIFPTFEFTDILAVTAIGRTEHVPQAGSDRTFEMWTVFPPEFNGASPRAGFDVYWLADFRGIDGNASDFNMWLRNVEVVSFDRGTLNN